MKAAHARQFGIVRARPNAWVQGDQIECAFQRERKRIASRWAISHPPGSCLVD
jgi:hypothetical protein